MIPSLDPLGLKKKKRKAVNLTAVVIFAPIFIIQSSRIFQILETVIIDNALFRACLTPAGFVLLKVCFPLSFYGYSITTQKEEDEKNRPIK